MEKNDITSPAGMDRRGFLKGMGFLTVAGATAVPAAMITEIIRNTSKEKQRIKLLMQEFAEAQSDTLQVMPSNTKSEWIRDIYENGEYCASIQFSGTDRVSVIQKVKDSETIEERVAAFIQNTKRAYPKSSIIEHRLEDGSVQIEVEDEDGTKISETSILLSSTHVSFSSTEANDKLEALIELYQNSVHHSLMQTLHEPEEALAQ